MQVFDYIVIAYITLRAFTEINLKKTFIQGQEEIETVIKSFYPDLAFSELPPFQKLQFLIEDFCLSFKTELSFSLDVHCMFVFHIVNHCNCYAPCGSLIGQ
jgi:hypothetical protein